MSLPAPVPGRLEPDAPLTELAGVGPARAARLLALDVETVGDLPRQVPRALEDRGAWVSIEIARKRPAGEFAAVHGRVAKRSVHRFGRRRTTLRATLEDSTGRLDLLWFNAPFLAKDVSVGAELAVSGRLSKDGALLQPEVVVRGEASAELPDRLVGIRAIYATTDGISQRFLRGLIGEALDRLPTPDDPLPSDIREVGEVVSRKTAWRWAHCPGTMGEAERGRERLIFDELLPLELAMRRRRRDRRRRKAPRAGAAGGGGRRFVDRLPFTLSPSQETAVEEGWADLAGPNPMGRLLAGEVGSGKTVVALAIIEEARSLGLQCALLAPTDLLARQHHRSAVELLSRGEVAGETADKTVDKTVAGAAGIASGGRVALLTGSQPAAEATETRRRLAAGEIDFVVGTHALLSKTTRFENLGLVVIDEQHRFGVEQRATLLGKARTPHALALTATPIPRTLALLAFGDSDVSGLESRPGARGETTTRVVPSAKRAASLGWVRKRLEAGEQAFLVRPRISGESAGAVELHDELIRGPLAGVDVGLVHGRLPADERDEIVGRFQAGRLRALVATTVIEVGLDIPGATILWVEGAERLGLAQLHQLRGRIARRGQRGYCWMVEGRDAPEGSRERLAVLENVHDGLRLAEIDLATRGPGELLGLKQSGRWGPFSGLGASGLGRITELAERAWLAADLIVAREESNEEGRVPCSHESDPVSSSSRS